jgi:phosphonate transport system substrate-binding protein
MAVLEQQLQEREGTERGQTMRIGRRVLLGVLVLVQQAVGAAAAERAAAGDYTFGVVPQFEQRKLYAVWNPIVSALEKETGLSLKLETTLKINDFEREYVGEKFDFVYMNPYFIVRGVRPGTYLPIARDNKPHCGILVVRKNGPIKTVADLEGKSVAFPTPNAIGATLMTRSEIEDRYGVKVKPLFVKTHSSVYYHVAKGLTPAGGGVLKTLQEQDSAVRDLLAVLYTTRPMPNLPVAAHKRVPADVREKLQRAFLALGETDEGRALLAKIPMTEVVATTLDEYLPIQTWGLERFFDPGWSED